MRDHDFVDHYELLECSPQANAETIERLFRFLAQRYHPDNPDTGDSDRLRKILTAYETLRDPIQRAAYDLEFKKHQGQVWKIAGESQFSGSDKADRIRMLSLFYAQRRRNMQSPGIGYATLNTLCGCPTQVLDFHLWYLREQGWLKREDDGLFGITAKGVDYLETSGQINAASDRLITMRTDTPAATPTPTPHTSVQSVAAVAAAAADRFGPHRPFSQHRRTT